MTQEEYEKIDKRQQIEMLQEIEQQFNVELPINEPKYDNTGSIINQKEVDESLKKAIPIIIGIWTSIYAIMRNKNIETMTYTNTFINTLKNKAKISKTMITPNEWDKIINQTVLDREKKVKIKQVIQGNANVLNKRVQQTVKNMYKNGNNYIQISKELQKQFGYSYNKAKCVAITERNYYKSSAQLEAIKNCTENIKKTWIHNGAREPRPEHTAANGQIADKQGYFHIGGFLTEAPQHFGSASQDINCHCTMKIEIIKQKGLASRNINTIEEHPQPYLLDTIKENEIDKTLSYYEKIIKNDTIENAIVVTKKRKVYQCFGNSTNVWPDIDLGDEIIGASITHNHPKKETNYSFSDADIRLFEKYKLSKLRGIDNKYTYELNRSKKPILSIPDDYFEQDYGYDHLRNIQYALDNDICYMRWKNER